MENTYSTQQIGILTDVMRQQKKRFDDAVQRGTVGAVNDRARQICETSHAITEAVKAMHSATIEKFTK
jgi:endonuclease III